MLHNLFVLALQVFLTSGLSLFFLRLGEKALNSWLCLLVITMNLFVIKQINILSLEVTATDALAIAYFIGLSLIQEYFGREAARRQILLSFMCSCSFVLISLVQLMYEPNQLDSSHSHFLFILMPAPRIFMASLTSFIIVQFVDIFIFRKLSEKFKGKFFAQRTGISLIISQVLDTFIFSYLALAGMDVNLENIIIFSLSIKIFIIFASLPFTNLSKKIQLKEIGTL